MNQCDGCMAGHPLNARGHHIPPHKKGEYANGMVCQKDKYIEEKLTKRIRESERAALCLDMHMCPKCGEDLVFEWKESRKHWLTGQYELVTVKGRKGDWIARAHCNSCNKTYTVD